MATDEQVRTQIRLPADLHRRLSLAAESVGRSLNAEMVQRLSESFPPEIEDELFQRRVHEANMLKSSIKKVERELETFLEKMKAGDFSPYGQEWLENVIQNKIALLERLTNHGIRIAKEIEDLAKESDAQSEASRKSEHVAY